MKGDEEKKKKIISWTDDRPKNYYRDCVDRPRPCPWVGCKHHLMLDVNQETGSITLNVGRKTEPNGARGRPIVTQRGVKAIPARGSGKSVREVNMLENGEKKLLKLLEEIHQDGGAQTCVLDCVADDRSHTLEEVGVKLGVTRERIRQIESIAERKLRELYRKGKLAEWTDAV